jgi:hypothetical protein
VNEIKARFAHLVEERAYLARIREGLNVLFTEGDLRERVRRGLWTPESERVRKASAKNAQLRMPELDF